MKTKPEFQTKLETYSTQQIVGIAKSINKNVKGLTRKQLIRFILAVCGEEMV